MKRKDKSKGYDTMNSEPDAHVPMNDNDAFMDEYYSSLTWKLRLATEQFMKGMLITMFILVMIPLLSLIIMVIVNGIDAILTPEFYLEAGRSPLVREGGIAHAMLGTLIMGAIGCVLGIPLGLLVGIYLGEFGKNKFGEMIRLGIETMAGIPTIITGVVVYSLIVITMGSFSALAGGIALAFIMTPIIARTTDEMIRLVPNDYREAAYSLGLNTSTTVLNVVLPSASRGIITGIILSVARALGETAPLLFTALFTQQLNTNLRHPMASLTTLIFTYGISPFEYWQKLAWGAALIILLINLVIVLVVRGNGTNDRAK